MELVLKTSDPKGSVGSNPTPSAVSPNYFIFNIIKKGNTMGADSYSTAPLTTRQKVAGAVHKSGVNIPVDQVGTLIDAIVEAVEPKVATAENVEPKAEA